MTHRTRIKICGITREEDLAEVVAAGVDAVGFVFYPKSPRYVTPERAAELCRLLPPFVTAVGLFVNASVDDVMATVRQVPLSLLQFHGDETVEQCDGLANAVNRPFIRAMRIGTATVADDLLKYASDYQTGSRLFAGLLLDTLVEGYGGSGKVFDWSLISKELAPQVVLSGGLNVQNATDAVLRVRPYAVDISSGVEHSKGIKDAAKIRAFIAAIRLADASPNS
ncbi:MAG: phosphoribosylanthranilate isomerase [Glaciimonas sp.]|nr:phosphoribosylanthranilate isomerase [Glaciimonas sp.]